MLFLFFLCFLYISVDARCVDHAFGSATRRRLVCSTPAHPRVLARMPVVSCFVFVDFIFFYFLVARLLCVLCVCAGTGAFQPLSPPDFHRSPLTRISSWFAAFAARAATTARRVLRRRMTWRPAPRVLIPVFGQHSRARCRSRRHSRLRAPPFRRRPRLVQ